MNKSRSDKTNSKRREYYLAKRDDWKNRRMDGFLHPKSYLWVINEAFDGGLKDIPERLLTLFSGACGAWGWRPSVDHLARWERERFDVLLSVLEDGKWEIPQGAPEVSGGKEP